MAFSGIKKYEKWHTITSRKKTVEKIEALTQAGSTNKEIAAIIGVSVSTIGRELKRNCGDGSRCYDCERAQKLSEKRRKDSKEPKISEKTWKKVFELFNLVLRADSERCKDQPREHLSQDLCWNSSGSAGSKTSALWTKKATAAFAETPPSRSLETFDRKPSGSQFASGIWPLGRRYRWTDSRAKLSRYDGRTQYAFFGGGTCRK